MAPRLAVALLLLALSTGCATPRVVRLDTGEGAPLEYRPPTSYADEVGIQWVVTQEGELLIIPHTWRGKEIMHVVASGGRPVRAAGEAELAVHGTTRFGIRITPHSGHYLRGAPKSVNDEVLEIGRQAFARFGIHFPASH